MKKWEYKSVEMNPNLAGFDGINELGGEGWELVAVVPKTNLGYTGKIYFIFKRETRSKKRE